MNTIECELAVRLRGQTARREKAKLRAVKTTST